MKRRFWIRITFVVVAITAMFAASVPVWYGYLRTCDVQEGFPFRKKFVSVYGLFRRVTGARECNRCVKLLGSDQLMLPSDKRWNMMAEASRTAAFAEFCRTNGAAFLFVQLPKKLDVDKTMLPPGVGDFAYDNADDLLLRLKDLGVAAVDWRPRFAGSPQQVAENFYVADTHWNNLTSLRAARDLSRMIGELCETDARSLARADELLEAESWNRRRIEHYSFGALARRTGRHFSEVDDVTALWPKFETRLTVALPEEKSEQSGSFLDVAVPNYARVILGKDSKRAQFSSQYAGGANRLVRLVNEQAPLDAKVLLIGDSFSRSLRTYLWVAVREIVSFDPRMRDQSLDAARLVLAERPDIVIQMPTAAALTSVVRAGEKRGRLAAFDYGL